MKKRLLATLLSFVLIFGLTACGNMQLIDTTWSYEKAIIQLPDGTVIEGECESWTDFENSDQIQVKIDGKQYLVHSEDVVLISE
jgi:hypothetical protein